MSEGFQKTVNLKEKAKLVGGAPLRQALPSVAPSKLISNPESKISKAEELGRVFNENTSTTRGEMQKIEQPSFSGENLNLIMKILALAVVLVILVFAAMYLNRKLDSSPPAPKNAETRWYMVVLADSQEFYGQISDTTSDPVVIKNVYYNYDKDKQDAGDAQSLRLVKRGKETQGGDGSINIIRSQVKYFEPLREDSKVLKAIVEYEKSK